VKTREESEYGPSSKREVLGVLRQVAPEDEEDEAAQVEEELVAVVVASVSVLVGSRGPSLEGDVGDDAMEGVVVLDAEGGHQHVVFHELALVDETDLHVDVHVDAHLALKLLHGFLGLELGGARLLAWKGCEGDSR
jgi:hypothetical protein